MYEPVVLRKKQPRTVAATPAAKVFTIITLIKVITPTVGVIWLSGYIRKKQKLLDELNELDLDNRKLTVREEYFVREQFWSQPLLRNITRSVYQKFMDNNQLDEVGLGQISISELHDKMK